MNTLVVPYVYKITNLTSGEFYIGFRSGNVRLKLTPENDLLVKYFTSGKLKPALRNNTENFKAEILFRSGEVMSGEEGNWIAFWYEQLLIKESYYLPLSVNRVYMDPDTGVKAFCGGGPLSEETKLKISVAHTGKKQAPITEETRKRLSEASKRRGIRGPHSEDAKRKMSEAKKGIYPSHLNTPEVFKKLSEANSGRIHSEESRRNMSEAQKGKTLSNEAIAKRSATNRGRKHTKETIEKMRSSQALRQDLPGAREKRQAAYLKGLETRRKNKLLGQPF